MSSKSATEVKFSAGETLFLEKSPCSALFYLKTGQVLISRTREGRKVLLGMVGSGEYLGESSVILDLQHSSTAEALTDVVAIQFTKESIQEQLQSVPSWLLGMTRGLVQKLQHTNEILNRNGIRDESLSTKVNAIIENEKRRKAS